MLRVTAAVLRRAGRILIARRRGPHYLAGMWEFPGGKIEPGETAEECLARELLEELGLRARIGAHFATTRHRYPELALELVTFEAEYLSGELELVDHDEALWVAPADLGDYRFAPADLPIVRLLLDAGAPDDGTQGGGDQRR